MPRIQQTKSEFVRDANGNLVLKRNGTIVKQDDPPMYRVQHKPKKCNCKH